MIVSGSSSLPQVRSVTCYGCNTPRYIKSNCPNCSKSRATSSEHVTTMYSDFFGSAIENTSKCKLSLIHVTINNHHGTAYFDSGAQSSLVGAKLRQLLIVDGVPSSPKKLHMTLADGVTKEVNAEYFTVEVILQDLQEQRHHLTLVSIPKHVAGSTLLGIDFLKSANIVLDMPNEAWYYGDTPHQKYPFVSDTCLTPTVRLVEPVPVESDIILRPDEGSSLTEEQKSQVNHLLLRHADLFEFNTEATPFAEHAITLMDDLPVATPPYRLAEQKKAQLKVEIESILAQGIIEDCESPYASPVVLVPKKDGSIRLTVDYRKLNAKTKPDRYPLPMTCYMKLKGQNT